MQATYEQWSYDEGRIKWSAIFGGLAVGIAVQMVFTLLGLAVGAWSIDLRDSHPTDGIPLGTGIWTGISMLISAFTGGYIASRLSGGFVRMNGLYHGAVLWGVTSVVFAWLATTALSFMIGGLFTTLGSGVQMLKQSVGTVVSAAAKVSDSAGPNVTAAGLRAQIESVLKSTEKSALQPGAINKDIDKVTAQVKDGQSLEKVTDSSIEEIKEKLVAMDRDAAVNVMVNKLGLSEKQAQEVAQSAVGLVSTIKEAGKEAKEKSMDIGNAAMTGLGSAAWWLFVLALGSLGASLIGGALGIDREPLQHSEGDTHRRDVKRVVNN